jgi:hypothetical protein
MGKERPGPEKTRRGRTIALSRDGNEVFRRAISEKHAFSQVALASGSRRASELFRTTRRRRRLICRFTQLFDVSRSSHRRSETANAVVIVTARRTERKRVVDQSFSRCCGGRFAISVWIGSPTFALDQFAAIAKP